MNAPTPRGWIAQVQGHGFDLAYWEQSLKPPFDPVCERIPHGDSTVWGLRSTAFDQLQSVEEVRAQAIIMIARLNGALRAQCGAEPLTLQGWPASTTAEIFISVSFRKPVPGRGQW